VVYFLSSYRVVVECENSVFAVSTFGLGDNPLPPLVRGIEFSAVYLPAPPPACAFAPVCVANAAGRRSKLLSVANTPKPYTELMRKMGLLNVGRKFLTHAVEHVHFADPS
jgi:hypothetical protein